MTLAETRVKCLADLPRCNVMEQGLTKTRVIAELAKSPHGKLSEYVPTGMRAAAEDPDFFAHLVAWSAQKSEIRDARVALPVIALAAATERAELENAAAHVAALDPRLFLRAVEFARTLTIKRSRLYRRLVARYLAELETVNPARRQHVVLQHRKTLRRLYTLFHVKPSPEAELTIVKGHGLPGSIFDIVKSLSTLPAEQAAGLIVSHRIPFLIAAGAMKQQLKSVDVLMALMSQMSPTELVTNAKFLEKCGIRDHPELRATFEAAIARAGKSRRPQTTFKASVAAKSLADPALKAKVEALQETQANRISVDGDWLVIGDKSSSMTTAIETAKHVAATLARSVKGQVHLVFVSSTPVGYDVTGKTLEEIKAITSGVRAGGNTSIGCGLQWALDRGLILNGVAIVSDGGENTVPRFPETYGRYVEKRDVAPVVYLYLTTGDPNALSGACESAGLDVQEFDLRGGVDYYSLPNLVQTMRVSRYALIDEIMATPLKRLDEVLPQTITQEVFSARCVEVVPA